MDKLLRGVCFNNKIAFSFLKTTDTVNEAIRIHNLAPTPAAALGRALTATAFMASGLKNATDALSVTIRGNGACGHIVTAANSNLELRGMIDNPTARLAPNEKGKLDVAGAVGRIGELTVVRSMGLKEPYVGTCKLVSGELAEDFAAYYAYSEQQPTAMALGVGIDTDGTCYGAGGVVFQPLPDAGEEEIAMVEAVLPRLTNVSALYRDMEAEEVLDEILGGGFYFEQPLSYHCQCSKERFAAKLTTLGKQELENLIAQDGKIEVKCDFCQKTYTYYENDVQSMTEKYER
ncbi:MAG: Hsp33 family molecular chaperone HslO [Clostridia bacterium]|jgi:molecular chaperone Hsp33|nr:Hsp33 family molecular chaperone HslO [Clostridia bacterium]MBQ5801443.1 Hsp33 family molecular chaperone HslO [Clostridia bacterium]